LNPNPQWLQQLLQLLNVTPVTKGQAMGAAPGPFKFPPFGGNRIDLLRSMGNPQGAAVVGQDITSIAKNPSNLLQIIQQLGRGSTTASFNALPMILPDQILQLILQQIMGPAAQSQRRNITADDPCAGLSDFERKKAGCPPANA
jgi:hypothetical protein